MKLLHFSAAVTKIVAVVMRMISFVRYFMAIQSQSKTFILKAIFLKYNWIECSSALRFILVATLIIDVLHIWIIKNANKQLNNQKSKTEQTLRIMALLKHVQYGLRNDQRIVIHTPKWLCYPNLSSQKLYWGSMKRMNSWPH